MVFVKRYVAWLGIFSMLFLFAGCGEGSTPTSPSQEEISSPSAEPSDQGEDGLEAGSLQPWSEEFSLTADGHTLTLGEQSGSFPWGMPLEKESTDYPSMDGFDIFRIRCTDGTELGGQRKEGAEDETDGLLTNIVTTSSQFQTHRGASVGMGLKEVQECYPDLIKYENTESGENIYAFTGEEYGLSSIEFAFEEDVLTTIRVIHDVC